MENLEGKLVEVNEKGSALLTENILNLHIGEIYRVQIGYIIYEGILAGFVAKINKREITPYKIKLRNGFVFDFRYSGTELEKIILFLNVAINYEDLSKGNLTSYAII